MTNEGDTRHLDGELEQAGARWQLRFTRPLAHSQAKVWRAITEAGHLETWFPFGIEGEMRTGAPLRFVGATGTTSSSKARWSSTARRR